MKKFNIFFAVTTVFMAVCLSSCGGNKPDDKRKDYPNAVEVNVHMSHYYGKFFSHYTDFTRLLFGTDGTSYGENGYAGTGQFYLIDICADVDANKFPKTGVYKLGNASLGSNVVYTMFDNGMVVPPFVSESRLPFGCYRLTVENDEIVTVEQAVAATVDISGNSQSALVLGKFTFEEQDDNGNVVGTKKDECMVYEGVLKIEDQSGNIDAEQPFEAEPKNVTTENFTFTDMQGVNNGDIYSCGLNVFTIELQGDNNELCQLILYAPANGKPIGKYTVTHRTAEYTADRSAGASSQGIYPPFIGIAKSISDNSVSFDKLWFIESGSVTIENEKISVDVKSHNGSTIKGVYDGIVTFTSGGRVPEANMRQLVL